MELNPNLSEQAKKDYFFVKAAVNGDQQAYTELLNRYKDSIYYMLLKIVNNKDDAEDLTIEAFGKAFKNIHQYTPTYAFSTWLFKIASNNCIDFLRKKKNLTVSFDNNPSEIGIDNNISFKASILDPEEDMIRSQKTVIMRNFVKKLKPRYKNLIELRYFKEYTYEEIAKELDLPLGTVKAQLFRARELLYNILRRSDGKI